MPLPQHSLTHYSIDTHFDVPLAAFENIVGKGEIACNKQNLLFPRCFLLNQMIVPPFVHIFDTKTSFAAESEEPNIGLSGKGLKVRILLFRAKMLFLVCLTTWKIWT